MKELAFIGAGKMGTAICKGLLTKAIFSSDQIIVSEILDAACIEFEKTTGISCVKNVKTAVQSANSVLLAVKPQAAEEVLSSIREEMRNRLLISIAAGIPLRKLKQWCCSERIIRVMPNTPVTVGKGATVYCCSAGVFPSDRALVEEIFGSVGIVREMQEEMLDAVTGLSGSGPAYVFEFVQALVEGAVRTGLNRDDSLDLIVQTVSGSAEMIREKLGSPDELRKAVTSPGGTTEAGLKVLENGCFRTLMATAVEKATERSIELGKL